MSDQSPAELSPSSSVSDMCEAIERARLGIEALQRENDALLRQRDELADALASVLASAYPNASDHPAMFEAWVKGRTALRNAGRLP